MEPRTKVERHPAETARPGYNERLFGGGLRGYIHNSRFHWIKRICQQRDENLSRVLELGCFDGRLLDWLPTEPDDYLGLDAGWSGGIQVAQARYRGHDGRRFVQSTDVSVLAGIPDNTFTAAFALETLEHLPPADVETYLSEIARVLDGTFYVTVPNEKGLVFLLKYTLKALYYGDNYKYSAREVLYATLCRMDRVARDEHKGFDYAALIRQMERHFRIERVSSMPLPGMPPVLGVTVGIVARSR